MADNQDFPHPSTLEAKKIDKKIISRFQPVFHFTTILCDRSRLVQLNMVENLNQHHIVKFQNFVNRWFLS